MPFTLSQGEAASGWLARGFVRAFHELAQPAGPGCSCVPSYEVNRILDLDPGVLWNVAGHASAERTLGGDPSR